MCRAALTVKTFYEPSCKVYGASSWRFLVGYGPGLKGVGERYAIFVRVFRFFLGASGVPVAALACWVTGQGTGR